MPIFSIFEPIFDFEMKGKLSPVASKIALKILYLSRACRIETLWAVNSLAREVSRWTVACDKRLLRLVGFLHHNDSKGLTGWVGDPASDIVVVYFADASFADSLRDSKSTSGE